MDTPSLLAAEVADDTVEAKVPLGGDDLLVVTSSRTLVYRAEGLLRDESVETVAHDVERVEVTEGRRKTAITTTTVTGEEEFTVPTTHLDDVLAPLLSSVLHAAGETAADEAVLAVYRFSELTLVVTEGRVVKHVGAALWDTEYESYPFSAVTDLGVEEGNVATQLVLTVDGRPQRIKAPSEQAGAVRRTLQRALFDYHGVDSLAALRARVADEAEDEDGNGNADEGATGGEAEADDETADDGPTRTVEPLLDAVEGTDDAANEPPASEEGAPDGTAAATTGEGTRTGHDDEVLERLSALEATVARQTELVERQQATIETLVEELRQGR